MQKENKIPKPSETLTFDGANFNLVSASKQSLADFQAAHADQWPGLTEDKRNANLASVHQKAVTKFPPTDGTSDNGSGSATENGGAGAGTGTGAGNTGNGANSGGVAETAAETGTGAGRKRS